MKTFRLNDPFNTKFGTDSTISRQNVGLDLLLQEAVTSQKMLSFRLPTWAGLSVKAGAKDAVGESVGESDPNRTFVVRHVEGQVDEGETDAEGVQ